MKFLAPFALILSQLLAADAFVTAFTPTPSTRVAFHCAASNGVRQSTDLRVASENDESPDMEASAGEAGQESEEANGEPEDPELKAVREEIEQLESTLKEKRRELAYVSDKAEEYTKSGYARKVAEMENMRRARSMLASSNKSGAMAGVLTSFVPILDKLGELQNKYGNDDFGKSYNALQGVMRQVYTDLGAAEYAVNTGDVLDASRMDAVETEYSETHPQNTVIQALSTGWELQGNVIRSAQCVVSLGSENAVEEAPQQDAGQSPPIDPTEHMSYGEDGTK